MTQSAVESGNGSARTLVEVAQKLRESRTACRAFLARWASELPASEVPPDLLGELLLEIAPNRSIHGGRLSDI